MLLDARITVLTNTLEACQLERIGGCLYWERDHAFW